MSKTETTENKRGTYKARDDKAESYLTIRVKRSDKAIWVKAAQRMGLNLSQFVINRLNDKL